MRTKTTILLGAIAALALATLSANAGNQATHRMQGSVLSLVAATTTVAKADRDAVTIAARSAAHEPETAVKPVVAVKPAAAKVIATTAACQDAINALKALRQADVTEDASERAAQKPISANALEADKAEDAAEKQQWRTALLAARNACVPQPSAACQAAIAALQALKANGIEDLEDLRNINWPAQLTSVRTAVAGVATACGDRD